jgi:hypothetical protein
MFDFKSSTSWRANAVGKPDELLLAFRRGPNDDQQSTQSADTGRRGWQVSSVPILLQKSPGGRCGIEI